MNNDNLIKKNMFALIKHTNGERDILISSDRDRRTHYEWLSQNYISFDHYRKIDMGYIGANNNIIMFHGNSYQLIEEFDDILFIVKQLYDKLDLDFSKSYVYNGLLTKPFDVDLECIKRYKISIKGDDINIKELKSNGGSKKKAD